MESKVKNQINKKRGFHEINEIRFRKKISPPPLRKRGQKWKSLQNSLLKPLYSKGLRGGGEIKTQYACNPISSKGLRVL